MPVKDFSAAYRDSTKGSTLKALALRRAELQTALASQKPREVKSPWQGAANIADTISGAIREGRLANQEAAGRERFAQLLAGGLSPDEIGEAMGLDPDTTMKYQERTWAQEDTKAEREYNAGRDETKHGWDVEAASARVKAEQEAAAASDKSSLARQDDQQAAAITLADHNATIEQKAAAQKVIDDAKAAEASDKSALALQDDQQAAALTLADRNATIAQKAAAQKVIDEAALKTTQSELDIKKEKETRETFTQVTPEMVAEKGLSGDIAAHPEQFQISSKTGEITPYQKAAGAPVLKEVYDAQDKLASIDSHLDDLTRAMELNSKIIQGPMGNWAAEAMGSDPTGLLQQGADLVGQKDRIEATKEFTQLMSAGAMTRMAEELKGSTAYQEVLHYQNIFASPTATEEVRRNALESMINVLRKHRAVSAERIASYGADKPGDYVYTPRGTPAGDAAATAPAGGAAPPAPQTEEDFDKLYPARK